MRSLRLRWPTTCATCSAKLSKGSPAWWDDVAKTAHCVPRHGPAEVDPSDPEVVAVSPVPETRVATGHTCDDLELGVAGGSARREYERRAAKELRRKEQAVEWDGAWRRETIEARPVLGRVRAALVAKPIVTPESQSTAAWKTGAAGEERVAEVLASCPEVKALHDRQIVGTKANIDHIAVAPSGVYVIDAKKYTGAVEARDVGSFFRWDYRLYVGGRERTKLVDGVGRQVELVAAALGDNESAAVRGILCFVGAEWPLMFRRPVTVAGVTAVWPLGLPSILQPKTSPVVAVDVVRVAQRLAEAFPPA